MKCPACDFNNTVEGLRLRHNCCFQCSFDLNLPLGLKGEGSGLATPIAKPLLLK